MTDLLYDPYPRGTKIKFRVGPTGNKFRNGKYVGLVPNWPACVLVQLDGDPYAVVVDAAQVSKMSNNDDRESDETYERNTDMTTAAPAKTSAKDLRRQAKSLGVEGWEEMTSAELKTAIKEAKNGAAPATEKSGPAKAAPTKAEGKTGTRRKRDAEPADETQAETPKPAKTVKAKKSAAPAPAESADEGDGDTVNPYKQGSNLYFITEELLKGGKRSGMVKRLQRKIELKPRQRAGDDYDVEAELDRRILIVGQLLERDHGFAVTREGRGKDALIKAEKA